MNIKPSNPIVAIPMLVGLSLITALVLFGLLDSSGFVENKYFEFGGAAAGFIVTITMLHRWYSNMVKADVDKLRKENENLKNTLQTINVPPFSKPDGYIPFIDHEHSMLFCYPEIWKKQPIALNIQSMFSENPNKLTPGDKVPGRFVLAVSSPGQKSYSLKEVEISTTQLGIPVEEVNSKLGVEISEKTENLQVPMEVLLEIFGASGSSKTEKIYDMNYQMFKSISDEEPYREYILVNGIKSLLIETKLQMGQIEPLVQIIVITYIEAADLIYSFIFSDNLSDRDKADMMRKQIISTVQFWNNEPQQAQAA